MAIEKTQVRLEVQGEDAAIADAAKVEQALKAVESQAKRTQGAQEGTNRHQGLLYRLRDRGVLRGEGLEVGGLQMNRNGFGLNKGAVRGMAGLAGAFALGNAVGGALNKSAEFFAALEGGAYDDVDFAREIAGGVLSKAFTSLGTANTLRGLVGLANLKAFGGRGSGNALAAFDQVMAQLFAGGGETDLHRAIAAQADAALHAAKVREAQADAEERRIEFVKAALQKTERTAQEQYQRKLRGLRSWRPPLVLPEATYALALRQYELVFARERDAKIAEDQARANQLLAQEGS